MRSPLSRFTSAGRKAEAGIATRWLRIKPQTGGRGPDKAEPAAKTSRRRPYPVLMAWRQFISCPSPGGPGDLSF